MGKTYSKPLAARHGRGTAWARHAMCESALRKIAEGRKREGQKIMKVRRGSLQNKGNNKTQSEVS
jgi:hypothetical protein